MAKKNNSGRTAAKRKSSPSGSLPVSSSSFAPPRDYDIGLLWELLDEIETGVANVSPSGNILYANTRFLQTLKIPASRGPADSNLRNFIASASWGQMTFALEQGLRAPVNAEIQVAAVGEKPRTIRLLLSPIRGKKSPTVRIIATEVTELLEANRAVRETEASLRALSARILQLQDQERRRIARDLHDTTGQELAVLLMSLKSIGLRLRDANPELRASVDEAVDLAHKVNDEIRTLSYLLHPPLLDEFGLVSALKWYVEGFNKRSDIQVTLDFPEALPRFASDKETALFRVVQESLTNVLRHSNSRTAAIGVVAQSGQIKISVQDKGKGIDAQVLSRLRREAGTLGVGLPGLRERLRQFGGRLEIFSNRDGTRVLATLSIDEHAVPDSPQTVVLESLPDDKPQAREIAASAHKRILLADDHELMRRGIRALLQDEADLEICGEACNGYEAVQKTGELQPDLIIMDLSMPGVGGLSAAHKIRQSGSPVKILVFTNQEMAGIERMAQTSGCDGLVLKVNASRDLLLGIRAVLAGKQFYSSSAKAHGAS